MNDALPVSAKSLDPSLIKTPTTSKWENTRKRNYLSTPPDPPTFRYFYTPSHLPTWTNFPGYFFPPSSPETPDPLDTTNPPEHPDHLTHQIYLTCSYGPLAHFPTWPTFQLDPHDSQTLVTKLLKLTSYCLDQTWPTWILWSIWHTQVAHLLPRESFRPT